MSCIPLDQRAEPLSRLVVFRLSGFPVGRRPTEASWCAPAAPSVPTAGDADTIVLASAVADVAAAVAAACGVDGLCSGLKTDAAGRLGLRVDAGRRALLWCATVVLLLLILPAGFTVTGRYGAEPTGRGSGRTGPGLKTENSFQGFFFKYVIQHCFICRPSDSTVSEDAGIEPRTVATLVLTARRSNHSARSRQLIQQNSHCVSKVQ
jgi:hypothetical protein